MHRFPLLILLLPVIVFGACGSGTSPDIDERLVGTWQFSSGNSLITTSIICDLKPDGISEWLDIGRFSLSGNGLVLYATGGRTTLWER